VLYAARELDLGSGGYGWLLAASGVGGALSAVVNGRVVVHHDGTSIAHLGAGDYFGERGLLDEAPRNATVTTEEQSSLLRVEGDMFLDVLQTVPSLHSDVTRVSSSRFGSRTGEPLVDDPVWSTA
jgi:CRP/FNR family transcriptional regulator, cyclic AMP receptor protein